MATRDRVLLLRKMRLAVGSLSNQFVDLWDRLTVEVFDINNRLQQARDIVLAVRDEVRDARGSHATVADRLSAIEAQLPPNP